MAVAFDLQGHRGARGLAPENTLAAFRLALALGVTTLETDLAVTKDGVVVLGHEPRLNPDRAELERYDIGRNKPASKYASQFPQQKPVDGERIPTLAALYAMAGPNVRFNIETKIDPAKPDETLDPGQFTRVVVDVIRAANAAERTTLQSFDWRTLLEARRIAPEIKTACLTIESNNMDTVRRTTGQPSAWLGGLDLAAAGGSLPRLVKAAGCAVWSPFWRNVTADSVTEAHGLGLKVIPWTVNTAAEMAALVDLGVDGLITDYPDRAQPVLAAKGLKAR